MERFYWLADEQEQPVREVADTHIALVHNE